ncbi:MHYT domain-containing protein [Marinobacter sp. M216]|uniref:MHYT domain-containing protein n=1 Tax=Marinobacter albus TaxID=3030833 RepID=A0ABT7HDP0_9GAMM|nr:MULTISPECIES: MHYT domain-containing protein [unclassified Marinobacter]MBW7471909.1 diguanylate cyclase [Marinobacter sp. F4218]MDK9558479.1 MHYT domain-containing protein [Marinobacter sp. M216]
MLLEYDFSLVIASYVVAVLAAYTALYFGTRLNAARGGERRRWLTTGALLMGSGVWTMHFVGMRAMPMEAPLSFDSVMTAVSWLAAVVASGVALNIIGRSRISVALFAAATLAMSGGVVVMHYLGMYAMRMSADPTVNTGFLVLSVVIAVVASGAALAICRKLQGLQGGRAMTIQFAAALVMAAAICGMHYTGMVALQFPADAVPAVDNGLRGEWIGIPLAVACVLLLMVALVVTVLDVRARRELEFKKAEESRWVERMAFVDSVTGLPNRSGLEQELLDNLARPDAREHPFALLYLDVANFRELADRLGHRELESAVLEISNAVRGVLTETVYLARYSSSAFVALVPDPESADHAFMYKHLRQIDRSITAAGVAITWRIGQSVFPTTGNSSRKLVRAAMLPRDPGEIGHFANMKADPDLALPGQVRGS